MNRGPGKCVNREQQITENRRCDAVRIAENPVAPCRVATSCMRAPKKEKFHSAAATPCMRHCPISARNAARLERLVQHRHVSGARGLAYLRIAVGGDENRWQIRPAARPQAPRSPRARCRDRDGSRRARPAAGFRRLPAHPLRSSLLAKPVPTFAGQALERAFQIRRLADPAAPAGRAALSMPSSTFGSLSTQRTMQAGELGGAARRRARRTLGRERGRNRQAHGKCEPRPTSERKLDLVVEHARDTLHDRKPEAKPARDAARPHRAAELAEDGLPLRLRDPDAGVVDVDAQPRRAAGSRPARGPLGVYLIALETRFSSSRRSSRRSERTVSEEAMNLSASPLARASGVKSTSSWRNSASMRRLCDLRLHRAGIEPRNIEQRAQGSPRPPRARRRHCRRARDLALVLALDQARHIKPRGVERLQNVVARGRQKPRLGNVGVVGLGLGADQLGIESLELAGALAHATLERSVGALQRFRGNDARGDVGERGHDAGARHRVGAHLDHRPALGKALQERLRWRRRSVRAARDQRFRAAPGPNAPCSALMRRDLARLTPTRTSCGGRSRISPNCRFQHTRWRSLSNTAMPWRTWSSADCRISRL